MKKKSLANVERKKRDISLEEALEVIKANGLSISTPTLITQEKILAESKAKLKVKEAPKKTRYGPAKVKATPKDPEHLEITLTFPHTIGPQSYGPGKVTIPWAQRDLIPLLAQQDQIASKNQMETLTLRQSKFYMIIEANSPTGARNRAIEVDESTFRAQNIIHSEINASNAPHYAGINRSIMTSQGKMF